MATIPSRESAEKAIFDRIAESAGNPVLVHCTAGKDRTGVIIALLLDLANLQKHGLYVAMEALNALGEFAGRAGDIRDKVQALPKDDASLNSRLKEYPTRLIETAADRDALARALNAMCGSAKGAETCKEMHITRFVPVDTKALEDASRRYGE